MACLPVLATTVVVTVAVVHFVALTLVVVLRTMVLKEARTEVTGKLRGLQQQLLGYEQPGQL